MWINPTNQQTFTSHSEIRSAFQSVSFPAVMTEDDIAFAGLLPVTLVPQPTFDALTQKVTEAAPALVNGVWTQQWQIVALTPEEQQAAALRVKDEIVSNTQKRLDTFARTRNYDGILSLCTYATDTNPKFAAEGQYGVTARSDTWATLYQILDEVQAGTRPVPSGFADIEGDLPVLAWPA